MAIGIALYYTHDMRCLWFLLIPACMSYRSNDKALDNEDVLDKIRDEIEQIADEEQKHDKKWAIGLRYAVKIIDKYRGDKE